MTTITIFLTDLDHPRAWRGVVSEADAISRIRTSKVVQFEYADAYPEPGTLDQIFALTHDVVASERQALAAAEYRRDGQTRSLSVGDIVHLPGLGIYAVDPTGWRKLDHRLTAIEAGNRLAVS